MAKCSFCGNNIERGTGKIYVEKTAKLLYFCSTKCEKNLLKLRRKPLATKWTRTYEKAKTTGEEKPAVPKGDVKND